MSAWNDDVDSVSQHDVSDGPAVRDGDNATTTGTRMSELATDSANDAGSQSVPSGKLIGLGYAKRDEIGRGTYGTVYDGVHVASQRHVAIKKVIGRSTAGEAEAALLRLCDGADHVVQLLDVVRRNGKIYLVLEFMDTDLETVIKDTEAIPTLEVAHIKGYLRMLLQGVQELHARQILHRDLKPNNLLINKYTHIAKLTDFGMATQLEDPEKKRSIQVVTRAYRAPELFFGQDVYGVEIDMWSVGCIFAEMVLRRPFFDGSSDIDQLSLIFTALGSPTENGWETATKLPYYLKFKDTHPNPLREQFPELTEAGVDLLSKLLQVDPTKRISATDALQHPFFCEDPTPASGEELPVALPVDPKKKRTLADVLADTVNTVDEGEARDGDDRERLVIKGRRLI